MDDNLFIEYINSPYEEPQDMLPKIDETMLTDMESSLETDFKNEYQHEDVTSILESIEYIRIYCRNFPCFNGFDYQPLQAPFAYYRSREIYLKELPFTEDGFYFIVCFFIVAQQTCTRLTQISEYPRIFIFS